MKIGLVVSDIDNTLLPKDGTISARTRRTVAALGARGIHFALASGRWFPSTASVAAELGLKGPLIAANGGCVATTDGEILKEFFMADGDAAAAYEILRDSGALITSYVRGAIHRLNAGAMENRPPEKSTQLDGHLFEVVDDDPARFEREALKAVYKMEAYSNDKARLAALGGRLSAAGLSVSSSFHTNIEVTSAGLGKGAALLWLAAHLNVPREAVMAFGDNTNDIGMLEAAGWGVAMGNAVPALKAAARLVAPDCAADGLARAIEEHVL